MGRMMICEGRNICPYRCDDEMCNYENTIDEDHDSMNNCHITVRKRGFDARVTCDPVEWKDGLLEDLPNLKWGVMRLKKWVEDRNGTVYRCNETPYVKPALKSSKIKWEDLIK